MARTFNVAPVPYIGNFTPKPISLCRNDAGEEPNSVTLEIPWTLGSSLGQGVYDRGAVMVDLTVQGPSNPLKRIRSMVIDNTAVNKTVYVKFQDTLDVITVLPNTVERVAVLTNSLQFNIFTSDFFTVEDGNPITRFLVTNVYLDPLVEREINTVISEFIATNDLTFTAITQAGALGDVSGQQFKNLTPLGASVILAPQSQGFYIIRDIVIYTFGTYSTTIVKQQVLHIETIGAGSNYFDVNLVIPTDLSQYARRKIFEKTDMNWQIDATVGFQIRNSISTLGVAEINLAYTYTPLLV